MVLPEKVIAAFASGPTNESISPTQYNLLFTPLIYTV